MNNNNTYDVIVVGGGGSGLAAAVSAAKHGASVLLLEKQAELGGTTGIAVGSFTANRTRFQKSAGVEDSLDAHAEDAGKFPPPDIESKNNPALRKFFLNQSAQTLDWLMEMGLRFYGPSPEPPNRLPRMHNVIPGAKAYIAALQAQLLKHGGVILTNAAVVRLVGAGEGRITGVAVQVQGVEQVFTSRKGVVLAAGDYTNAPDLIGRFKGEQYTRVEGINPNSTGDGHRLAEMAGARLVNMEITYGPEIRFVAPPGKTFQQLLPSNPTLARFMSYFLPLIPGFVFNWMLRRLLVTWQHPENSLYANGAILVNQEGRRFCNETQSPEREIAIASQFRKICYILLDESIAEMYSQWPNFISTAPKIAYAYVKDYLRLRPDVAIQGSLAQIADARQIPLAELQKTISATNAERRASGRLLLGQDGKPNEKWVLLGPAKAYFTTTEGGAAIDETCQVLDTQGEPIPGLYAVGQNGLGGQVLWGHGLHIAWALTSGRLVGERLAKSSI